MPAKTRDALPAKLRPPRLLRVVARERLHAWLDARREATAIWLCGPPGAGKTTLVAAYLQARSQSSLWYRFDADDNDLGRVFAMLGQAVDALQPRVRRPPFLAEHLARPKEFARTWFRSVFTALHTPVVVVFDNIEQATLALLAELLAVAVEEAPPGVMLIVTARQAPPPALSAAVLGGALVTLPTHELAFSTDESRAYAAEFELDPAVVERAALRVDGWAAGLRLLSQADDPSQGSGLGSQERLFDYFAGLLHDALAPRSQQLLLAGALLPWMPARLLARIAHDAQAPDDLERLCAHSLFVEAVAGAPGVFRLHPLFRAFLLHRGRSTLTAQALQRIQRDAAQAFEGDGHVDAAIDLLLDAGDHAAALDRLLKVLEEKLAMGQLDQWLAWAQRLPQPVQDGHAGLQYGLARLAFLREDGAALGHYERAHSAFVAAGDRYGERLCAAGALEWIYNTDSFIAHGRWCEVMRQPQTDGRAPDCEEHAWRLLNGELLACFYLGEFEAHAQRLTDAVVERLRPGRAENDKLSTAVTLLGCMERHKRWGDAPLLAGRMQGLLGSPHVGPLLRVLVRQQIASDLHRQTGAFDEAQRASALARTEAREIGFAVVEFEAVAVLLLCALYTADDVAARKWLVELQALVSPANVYHQRFAQQALTWQALQGGRVVAALEHAQALRNAVARSDMPAGFRATWLLVAVFATFAGADADLACRELAALCSAAEAGSRATLEVNLLALTALQAWRAGRGEAAAEGLTRAFALAAEARYYQLLGPLRTELAQLCGLALERSIAAPFVRELVRRRHLAAPLVGSLAAPSQWPWALHIRTLGHFTISVDGAPMKFDGKVPKRPLAVLKALIALGPEPVALAALADALWPGDEADAAHDALNVALHRLRRLLPNGAELVRLQDGRVWLDTQAIWVDAYAFERIAKDDAPLRAADAAAALREALLLYRGHFLASDADEPWAVSTRERLRSRFRRVVTGCAAALVAAGQHEQALDCYKRALETDDLDETFYQGVMRSALALRRPAEGIAAYQRLRRTLALAMGVGPSPESERLLRSLQGL